MGHTLYTQTAHAGASSYALHARHTPRRGKRLEWWRLTHVTWRVQDPNNKGPGTNELLCPYLAFSTYPRSLKGINVKGVETEHFFIFSYTL